MSLYDKLHKLINPKPSEDDTELLSLKSAKLKTDKPTGKSVSDLINKREESMSFKDKLNSYKSNVTEGDIGGFNKYVRDFSNGTREVILKAKLPELAAFARDRKIDLGLLSGVAERVMSLGRVPDLEDFGLKGDVAIAVRDFMKDFILNLAEDMENLTEEKPTKAKHLKLASDYKNLADYHKRKFKEEADKASESKKEGKPHTAIQCQSKADEHKTLADHCSGLADYHQLQANKMPEDAVAPQKYPAQDPKTKPPAPEQGEQKEKAPQAQPVQSKYESVMDKFNKIAGGKAGGMAGQMLAGPAGAALGSQVGAKAGLSGLMKSPVESMRSALNKKPDVETSNQNGLGDVQHKAAIPNPQNVQEATLSANFGPVFKPTVEKMIDPFKNMLGKRPKTMIDSETITPQKVGNDKVSGLGLSTVTPKDKGDTEVPSLEAMDKLSLHLFEAKVKKGRKSVAVPKERAKEVLANAGMAKFYAALGHKLDGAESKLTGKKVDKKWTKLLQQTCLKSGGSAASDEVLKASLSNAWMRDQGFVDESSNLRRKWETAMSKAASDTMANSPTAPDPVVFTVNAMLKMAGSK